MSTPVDRALELSAIWDGKLRADLPECEIFDVHTHIGDDIDGMRGRPDELLSIMDAYGIAQAFTFCMDEPDRHPSFTAPNDRTLAWAQVTGGRLVPVGRHGHANGSFSQLGTYKLTVQASATMAAGAAVTSWAVECTLVVGPYEPPMPPPTTLIGHHPILLP